ncbi:hypothetical protein A9Q84_17200 [Halobacteriovorax marinus]|uniref:Uncharacterized protein n=1 Tax=Halobacteriovorax marinus TaxID=97084 RepID=A0A1Y5F3L3_9BACT|nr:hypothetical protein A9Q84_17200 [Halobacteriovorax marinus]
MRRITSKALLLLSLSPLVLASGSNTSVQKVDTGATVLSPSLALSTTLVTNNRDINDDSDAIFEMGLGASISLRSNTGYSFAFSFSGNKDLRNERKFTAGNYSLALSKSLGKPTKYISVGGKINATLPTSENSTKIKQLKTAISAQTPITWDGAQANLEGFSVTYMPKTVVYFHTYETDLNGTSNTQYKLQNFLILDYGFTDKLSGSLTNIYMRNFTYGGHTTDIFAFDQSISYSISKNFGASIGHSIGGNALAADGYSSDVKLYDKELSTYYLSLSFRI